MRTIAYIGMGAVLGITSVFAPRAYKALTKPDGIIPGEKYEVLGVIHDSGENPISMNPNPGWIDIDVKGEEDIAVPCKNFPIKQAKAAARRIAKARIIEVLAEPTHRYTGKDGKSFAIVPLSRLEIDKTEDFK